MKKLFISILLLIVSAPYSYSETLFYQNFNDTTTGTYNTSRWAEDFGDGFLSYDWIMQETNASIIDDASVYSGKSLRVTMVEGSGAGGGIAAQSTFSSDQEEIYISYFFKIQSDFTWNGGVKLIGTRGCPDSGCGYSAGGPKPDGTNGWSGRSTVTEDNPTFEAHPRTYTYHIDMPGTTGETEETYSDYPTNTVYFEYDENTWYHFEQRWKVNTPGDDPIVRDGIIQVWIDGVMVASKTDYAMRTVDTFSIDTFRFYVSTNLDSLATQWFMLDDIIISTHQISAGAATNSNAQPSGLQQCDEPTPITVDLSFDTNEPTDAQWCKDGVGGCDADTVWDGDGMVAYESGAWTMTHTHEITEECGQSSIIYRSLSKDVLGNVSTQIVTTFSTGEDDPPIYIEATCSGVGISGGRIN